MTKTILDKIRSYKLDEIAAKKAAHPLRDIEELAQNATPVRGFTKKSTLQ